jgi:hypothetical protein
MWFVAAQNEMKSLRSGGMGLKFIAFHAFVGYEE